MLLQHLWCIFFSVGLFVKATNLKPKNCKELTAKKAITRKKILFVENTLLFVTLYGGQLSPQQSFKFLNDKVDHESCFDIYFVAQMVDFTYRHCYFTLFQKKSITRFFQLLQISKQISKIF